MVCFQLTPRSKLSELIFCFRTKKKKKNGEKWETEPTTGSFRWNIIFLFTRSSFSSFKFSKSSNGMVLQRFWLNHDVMNCRKIKKP